MNVVPKLLVETGNLGAGFDAQLGIQVGERLIKEEDGRVTDDGAADSHTLALTTGELLWVCGQAVVRYPGFPQRLLHFLVDLSLGRLAQFQAESHVVVHTHVWVQRVGLEHHGDVPVLGWDIIDDAVANPDVAFCDLFQTGQQAQGG